MSVEYKSVDPKVLDKAVKIYGFAKQVEVIEKMKSYGGEIQSLVFSKDEKRCLVFMHFNKECVMSCVWPDGRIQRSKPGQKTLKYNPADI